MKLDTNSSKTTYTKPNATLVEFNYKNIVKASGGTVIDGDTTVGGIDDPD